jgi:hypothetical protein
MLSELTFLRALGRAGYHCCGALGHARWWKRYRGDPQLDYVRKCWPISVGEVSHGVCANIFTSGLACFGWRSAWSDWRFFEGSSGATYLSMNGMVKLIPIVFQCIDILLWAGVVFGLVVDMASCRMNIRRITTEHGPSGIPAVSFALYALRIVFRPMDLLRHTHRSWWFFGVTLACALATHILCQFGIPIIVSRRNRNVASR